MYQQAAQSAREEIPVVEYPKRLASNTATLSQFTERLRMLADRMGRTDPRVEPNEAAAPTTGVAEEMVVGFQRHRDALVSLEREVVRLEKLFGGTEVVADAVRRSA